MKVNIPCRDCICLAICKAEIDPDDYTVSVLKLQRKCQLFRSFKVNSPNRYIWVKRRDGVHHRLESLHILFEFLAGRGKYG